MPVKKKSGNLLKAPRIIINFSLQNIIFQIIRFEVINKNDKSKA